MEAKAIARTVRVTPRKAKKASSKLIVRRRNDK